MTTRRARESPEVVAVEVHHLDPGVDEVADELLLRVVAARRPRRAPAARSSSRRPGRPRLPVHLTAPWRRRGPRTSPRRRRVAVHVVPRSSRFTKKSLVSDAGRSVRTPSVRPPGVRAQHPQAADEHGHLRGAQGRAGSPGRRRRYSAGAGGPCRGSCGSRRRSARARANDSTSVCSCVASVRPGVNGTVDVVRRRPAAACSTAARAGEHDQVGQRDLLAACAALNVLLDRPRGSRSTVASWSGSLTSQPLCGSSRIRAPLAPPRLSLPRNVDADAHAVDDQLRDGQAGGEHLLLERGDVGVVDQLVRRPPGPGPARAASPAAPRGRGSAGSGPCRGGSA